MVPSRGWGWAVLLGACVAGGSMVTGATRTGDGFDIARDASLFSARFRVEFEDMNETFGDFGFELEVLEGERPRLVDLRDAYGEAGETEEVDVILGVDDREMTATLQFHYYGDVGFGVQPDDPEGFVVRVKRRED